ncbi:MAG: sulfite exporter TauE/SafE family protein [Acidobacteria bacterium]|jgi:uncharacterized membrane protein YfcA|nr:sulfite exporter TauE/SafE family protein [Acidobacteriota bacterium]
MGSIDTLHLGAAFAAAFLAGAINSVAGGGTLISFPTLLWLGLPPIVANATSTVAIWPGNVGSIWGFRRELKRAEPRMRLACIPGAIGGLIGAILLRMTPGKLFEHLVPFLILFAVVLFTVQAPIQRRLRLVHAHRSRGWLVIGFLLLLLVGIYGGYFGAGATIMLLSILAILGMTDILEMNAVTSLISLCINGVASILFIVAKLVYWPYVLVMAVGALAGGYGAAGVARRIGRTMVRRFVIVVGFSIAIVMFVRMARG